MLLFSTITAAGEILELSTSKEGGVYKVRIVAVLNAPEEYIYDVITDYTHAYQINPSITSVGILPSDHEGVVRVRHHSEHRIGLFSFEVEWTGDVVETGHGQINISTVPEISSFDSGFARWEIQTRGDRTYVLHESSLQPAFRIPPIIGTYFMKKHMKEQTLDTFSRIERQAQIAMEQHFDGKPEKFGEELQQQKGHNKIREYQTSQSANTH
jgi:hypothetical protein